MDRLRYVYIPIEHRTSTSNGILFSLQKGRVSAICDTMGKPGGHHAKWHKPDIEIKVFHGIIYM